MEILKNFGFDPVILGAQIVNFLIVMYLLKRFLYKPVLEMLKKREDTIQEGIKQAEEARKTLEKTLEEEKKILTKAHDEAKNIIENAKNQSLETSKELEEKAQHQAENIILQAKKQIEEESKETERRLMEKISTLSGQMITKSLEGILSEKEQKEITNKTLKQINKVN